MTSLIHVVKRIHLLTLLLALPLAGHGQVQAPANQNTSDENKVFQLRLRVTDVGTRYFTELGLSDFSLFLDKTPQIVRSINLKDEPVSVVFMVDLSGSMRGGQTKIDPYAIITQASQIFLQNGNPRNEYAVISFSKDSQLVLDWTMNPAEVINTLASFIKLNSNQSTYLSNACRDGLEKIHQGKHKAKAILLFSDGANSRSTKIINQRDLKHLLRNTEALFYTVNFGNLMRSLYNIYNAPPDYDGAAFLDGLAKTTGAIAFHPRNIPETTASLELIAHDLRYQYVLEFVPTPHLSDGNFHKVKVKLADQIESKYRLKGLTVEHREGFFLDKK